MNRLTIIIPLIAAALLGDASAADPPPESSPGPRCRKASWNPESFTFYGAKDTIIKGLADIPVTLSDHRLFFQVTQGESDTDVKLYEQGKDGTFTVTEWTTRQASQLLSDVNKVIIANKGVNCVGEQVKSILSKSLEKGKVTEGVAAPVSTEAAFSHAVKEAEGSYLMSGVWILC